MSIKKITPTWIKTLRKYIIGCRHLLPESLYWLRFDIRNSSLFRNQQSDLATLLIMGHVLEKGITMPERRLGFGQARVRELCDFLKEVIQLYGESHTEVQAALSDLDQYHTIHRQQSFALPKDIDDNIQELLKYKKEQTAPCYEVTKEEYFCKVDNFEQLAHQRRSVRWYSSKPVEIERIISAIELAQTAPSACNRQCTRVYVIASKEKMGAVVNLQNGNRGFGHLADKFLLLTADMKCWNYHTRTSAYLDTGIYAQNLLYALHDNEICACTLNAHLDKKQRKELQRIVGYSDSEIPVVFISIGNAPDTFMIAGSQRLEKERIFKVL